MFNTSKTTNHALSVFLATFQRATPFQATDQTINDSTNNDCENINASVIKIYHGLAEKNFYLTNTAFIQLFIVYKFDDLNFAGLKSYCFT